MVGINEINELLSKDEFAQRLGIDVSTLYCWNKLGYVYPVCYSGRNPFYSEEQVKAFYCGRLFSYYKDIAIEASDKIAVPFNGLIDFTDEEIEAIDTDRSHYVPLKRIPEEVAKVYGSDLTVTYTTLRNWKIDCEVSAGVRQPEAGKNHKDVYKLYEESILSDESSEYFYDRAVLNPFTPDYEVNGVGYYHKKHLEKFREFFDLMTYLYNPLELHKRVNADKQVDIKQQSKRELKRALDETKACYERYKALVKIPNPALVTAMDHVEELINSRIKSEREVSELDKLSLFAFLREVEKSFEISLRGVRK